MSSFDSNKILSPLLNLLIVLQMWAYVPILYDKKVGTHNSNNLLFFQRQSLLEYFTNSNQLAFFWPCQELIKNVLSD